MGGYHKTTRRGGTTVSQLMGRKGELGALCGKRMTTETFKKKRGGECFKGLGLFECMGILNVIGRRMISEPIQQTIYRCR